MLAATEWQGQTGEAWAEEWRRTDRTLAPLNDALLARILPFEGRRILDIGSGAGATSFALADALPEAQVTGLDLSDALVAAAQARSAGRPNVRFVQGDAARATPDGAPFDLIVSRHGVMFFEDPVAAFTHLHGLAPRGRLLFSCFRAAVENEWMAAMRGIIERHAPETLAVPPPAQGPFAFAEPARVQAILRDAGFAPPVLEPFDFDFFAGAGEDPPADALAYFRRIGPMARLAAAMDEGAKAAFLADLEQVVTAHRRHDGIVFRAAAWIVSSRA
ncbi:MAG TPA: class I SAM-dependent methyltransferase [Allosphingosinicella sp.]|nr:class I SAM-dependent methyltransferase [Allosphingosinicella sp.]